MPSYGYISRTGARRLRTRGGDPLEDGGDNGDEGDGGDDGAWSSAFLQQDTAQTRMGVEGATVVRNSDGGTDGGEVQFRELVQQGVLRAYTPTNPPRAARFASLYNDASTSTSNTTANTSSDTPPSIHAAQAQQQPREFAGARGLRREWDGCSSTPFLRGAGQVVAYDDPASLALKAQLAARAGMRGVNLFDVHGDTDAGDLADALRRGLGLQ